MRLSSGAFAEGGSVPRRHTCDGTDVSPPLGWTGAPENTRSFALLVEDPDAPAGTWVHWVLYAVPATCDGLAEGPHGRDTLPEGALEGINGWGRVGWRGPCPPSGAHRYFFRLYALDAEPSLRAGASADDVRRAAEGHVLAEAVLMGRYRRE